MTSLAICGSRTTYEVEVEHSLGLIGLGLLEVGLGKLQCELALLRGLHIGELGSASSHYSTLLHYVVHEVELIERGEVVVVIDGYRSTVLLHIDILQTELHELVSGLHLLELGTLVTGSGDDTIRAKVTLVRTGIVVTGVEAIEA